MPQTRRLCRPVLPAALLLAALLGTVRPAGAELPQDDTATAPAVPARLRICHGKQPGCDFAGLVEGLRAAPSGSIITIEPGVYREAASLRAYGVTLKARGVVIDGTAAEGKGALVIKGNDTVVDGLECANISVPDHNGACIRMEGRNLTLRNVYFHDSEEGLLANDETGRIVIEDSRLERLGANGRAHGVYVGKADALELRRSSIRAGKGGGHEVKSRAAKTLIEDCVIASEEGEDSRAIDISEGGETVIRHSLLEKGAQSQNAELIGFALEGKSWPRNSLLIDDSILILDRPGGKLARSAVTGLMRDSIVVGAGHSWASRLLSSVTNPLLPGRFGENLEVGEGVQWLASREAGGLPAYPAIPELAYSTRRQP